MGGVRAGMRSDATSEARVREEAPAALLPEGALSPDNCGEHARGKDGTACR